VDFRRHGNNGFIDRIVHHQFSGYQSRFNESGKEPSLGVALARNKKLRTE
jgi:hypothetical protein